MLTGGSRTPNGYGVLQRLPRLRRLCSEQLQTLPACLSRLTGLEELQFERAPRGDSAAQLDAVLQELTGLTSL